MEHLDASSRPDDPLPKLNGGDIELGNFTLNPGGAGAADTCWQAASALLREIGGVPGAANGSAHGTANYSAGWRSSDCDYDYGYSHQTRGSYYSNSGETYGAAGPSVGGAGGHQYVQPCYSQDWGRKFLAGNGGCIYIDCSHLECCLPEVLSAWDHVAAWHGMLRLVRDARHRANENLGPGRTIQVLANNSDGRGNSWGGHLDVLVSRRCWDNLFLKKLHYMLVLASHQVSSIAFTGAGKVGSENGRRPAVDYQISQRADFYEVLQGVQTMTNRPLCNHRDEPLCGSAQTTTGDCDDQGQPADRMARLHCIFYDSNLSHVACLLKVGVMQLITAMIEQEYVRPDLILDNPLDALVRWSHDPDLRATAALVSGRCRTAAQLQADYLEQAQKFVADGRAEGLVPRAGEIIALWGHTVDELLRRDFDALTPKLDWVLKRRVLEQAIRAKGLRWDSPQIKYLDHQYHNIDPAEGLYWAFERAGATRRVVTDAQIERSINEPPADTRAFLRAWILRHVDPESISEIDWDGIRLKFRLPREGNEYWPSYSYWELPMANPLRFTQAECRQAGLGDGEVLQSGDAGLATPVGKFLRSMGLRQTTWSGRPLETDGQPKTSYPSPSGRG